MRAARRGRAIVAFLLGGTTAIGASASAQSVVLQIKPKVGDTLWMRLDQQSELSGVKRTANSEATALMSQTMRMFSRAIIEGVVDKSTTVLAITDSVQFTSTDERNRMGLLQAEAQMRGQRARFRVTPDGTVGTVDDGDATREVAQVVSLMPATFPKSAIKVGESWIREMPLPAGLQLGAQLSGKLHVTFRLDSVTHAGDWAYVSMRGEMQPASGPGSSAGAVLERGMVNGTMLVDRKRGWLTESWFNIVVNSLQTFNPAKGILSMRLQTRITQHMHTFDRK